MEHQHKSSTPLRAKDIMPHPIYVYMFFLFNKTMSLFYSLFVFRLCYKIIGFSKLSGPRACGPRAYPSLARGYGPGLGLKLAGRAWAKHSRSGSGLGLNSSLRAWAGPGLKNYCGPGPGLDSNC